MKPVSPRKRMGSDWVCILLAPWTPCPTERVQQDNGQSNSSPPLSELNHRSICQLHLPNSPLFIHFKSEKDSAKIRNI